MVSLTLGIFYKIFRYIIYSSRGLVITMSLIHLINASLISANDEIYFNFKDEYFVGTVDELGMLYKTTCNGREVFIGKLPYENLTDWADACIQDISKAYITRFSAWKRCTHRDSGLILNNLRQLCGIFAVAKIPVTNATIVTLQQTISLLMKYVRLLKKQNESYRLYVYAEAEEFDDTPIVLPPSILTVAKLYDRYLHDKCITEHKIEKTKQRGRKISRPNQNISQIVPSHIV
ncbi:MAG: hypothetical protein CBC48_07115 [bacterium TMED88]|nr:MAG: hypothetical protein CBC48_07115 [bacterium TMED88]